MTNDALQNKRKERENVTFEYEQVIWKKKCNDLEVKLTLFW